MGAGDEGDWPLLEGQVLAPYRIHGLEWTTLTLDGEEIGGTLLSIDELGSAITGYRACFRASYEMVDRHQELRLEYSLDAAAAEAFARGSTLARHLYEETLSSRAFRSTEKVVRPPSLEAVPVVRACEDGFCPSGNPKARWVPLWDSQFGEAIVSPGDVNGDGWEDLAVKGDELTLWILFLDAAGRPISRKGIEPGRVDMNGFYFAHSLARIGDFDADGVPDLAVGAPSREKSERGRVVLLLLDRDGGVKKTQNLSGEPPILSTDGMCGFGNAVASVGDIDGNGATDLLVDVDALFAGIDFARLLESSGPEPHLLPLLRLDPDGSVLRATSLAARDIVGDVSDVTFGDDLAGLGDLDGDGISEIAMGFPYGDDGGEERGAVWITFLERDGSLRAKAKLSDWSGDFDSPLLNGDRFGNALTSPGDLDGDGVPDLLVAGEKELWILLLRRDGTVKASRPFGQRSGGFVPAEAIRSLAVLRGSDDTLRLAVGGVHVGKNPKEAVLWVLKLGPGPALSAL